MHDFANQDLRTDASANESMLFDCTKNLAKVDEKWLKKSVREFVESIKAKSCSK